jgi:hypothetical protein
VARHVDRELRRTRQAAAVQARVGAVSRKG